MIHVYGSVLPIGEKSDIKCLTVMRNAVFLLIL